MRLALRAAERHFGHVQAYRLGPITTEIPSGARIALLGESGAGKSTLLNLLGCLDQPTGGDIVLGDTSVRHLNDAALSRLRLREVGFIHQFFDLLPDLSAWENVAVPLWLQGRHDVQRESCEWLVRVGLESRQSHFVHQLSGGQQQRVAIARALAARPKLLLADEPTGSLDSATGETIMDLILTCAAQTGATLVIATHSERLAGRLSDRLVLADGRLVGS